MEPEKKEIKYSLGAPSSKSERRLNRTKSDSETETETESDGNTTYGCLKGGKKPTFRQFTRRSSLASPVSLRAPPTTLKHYRKCGKIHNNTVRVLLADQKTVNGLERDKKKLDKHSLVTVCDYLAKRNLYVAGSDVPEDILRETYKNAHIAGNVHNHDSDIMINNFLKGGESI
jgi:hypothetical protein